MAGMVKAVTAPLIASMATIEATVALPVMTSQATTPWVSAVSTCDTCSTTRRENRSETTPPTSRKTIIAVVRAAITRPSATAVCSTSSTAKASATGAIDEPVRETVRAMKNQRKSLSRNASQESESFTTAPCEQPRRAW